MQAQMDVYKSSVYQVYERMMDCYRRGIERYRKDFGDGRMYFDVDEALYPALKALFEENSFVVESCDTRHPDSWMVGMGWLAGMRIESVEDYLMRSRGLSDT